MDDLSAPTTPVVIIAMLLAICVSGISIKRNGGVLFPNSSPIVVPSQS